MLARMPGGLGVGPWAWGLSGPGGQGAVGRGGGARTPWRLCLGLIWNGSLSRRWAGLDSLGFWWCERQRRPCCGKVSSGQVPGLSRPELVEVQCLPELLVLLAGQHCGDATAHRRAAMFCGDLEVSVAGVLAAPRCDGGVGEDCGPGDQFGWVVHRGGDVTDDVELTADAKQDGQFASVLGRVHGRSVFLGRD